MGFCESVRVRVCVNWSWVSDPTLQISNQQLLLESLENRLALGHQHLQALDVMEHIRAKDLKESENRCKTLSLVEPFW